MAYWYNISLLVLNEDSTEFLVCKKDEGDITGDYIMPGGHMDETSVEECLTNEIKEELDCAIDFKTLKYVGEYVDVASGQPDNEISMELYQANLIGDPKPSSEIKEIHWIGKKDATNSKVSTIIRNKIIPSLLEKGILK